MNYTLNALDHFIETEKREAIHPKGFRTIAIMNFTDMSAEDFLATNEAIKYAEAPQWSSNASSYQEFRRMLEEGQIDILELTSKQKLLFLTCLSDPDFVQKMMANADENEEDFLKLQKALPIVLPVLRDSTSYTAEQTNMAHRTVVMFVECNQKVLNYRRYIEFIKQAEDEEA